MGRLAQLLGGTAKEEGTEGWNPPAVGDEKSNEREHAEKLSEMLDETWGRLASKLIERKHHS